MTTVSLEHEPTITPGDAHVVFDGSKLKFYVYGGELRHEWTCLDVGVLDGNGDTDQTGWHHKCPPGNGFIVGKPQALNPAEPGYGNFFTPIEDDPDGDMRIHGRAGIGVHGGGTADGAHFDDPDQALRPTYGCFRLHNADNEEWVRAVAYIQMNGGTVYLDNRAE
jgi:hypothetical protein